MMSPVAEPSEPANSKPLICPILCLCLTNHALDSFLEELLAADITSIIRVGSR